VLGKFKGLFTQDEGRTEFAKISAHHSFTKTYHMTQLLALDSILKWKNSIYALANERKRHEQIKAK
jgi:hypothetical protein